MSLSQKVAFNTIVQIISKTATVVFGLLTTIFLTRYFGREGYGDYMYVITLVVLFGAFADWGTCNIGVREAAKTKDNQDRILANVILLRLLLTLGAVILLILSSYFLPLQSSRPEILKQTIILSSLLLFLFATKASFGIVFQTKLAMQNLAVADISASFFTFLLTWAFIKKGLDLLPLIGAVILANVVALIVAWFLAKKLIKFDFRWDKPFVKNLIRESLPMGAILLMFTVDNKIDTIMLGSIKGSGAVGVYSVAYRIYDVLILGAAYLMNSLLPIISSLTSLADREKLKLIYQKTFDVLMLMGIGVAMLILGFAPLMVRIITQQRFVEFADSTPVLRLLSLALFLAYFNHLTGYTIVALGRQRPYFFVALTALIFNVVANLLVIPRLSYYGAAGVTVLTEGLVLIITTFFIFRLLKIVPSLFQFPATAIQIIRKKGKIF